VDESAVIAIIAAGDGRRPDVLVGVGDDAAVLAGDPPLVLAHDMLVEDVHFRWSTHAPEDLGHAALAVNLSDLAAMGAEPVAALVGLAAPADALDPARVTGIYAGMRGLGDAWGCAVVGGDTSTAAQTVIGVTAVGRMPAGVAAVTRAGGRPGDVLCVTGGLGASAAGRALLARGGARDAAEAALVTAHRRPTPRVAAGGTLAAHGAHAMMDVSDGLALDLDRLARACGLTAVLDLERVPVAPGVAAVAAAEGADPAEWAATGGEDFELLVALAPGEAELAAARLDVALTAVGHLEAGPAGLRVVRGRRPVTLGNLGWEHRV